MYVCTYKPLVSDGDGDEFSESYMSNDTLFELCYDLLHKYTYYTQLRLNKFYLFRLSY
jgi:hypothetical protein